MMHNDETAILSDRKLTAPLVPVDLIFRETPAGIVIHNNYVTRAALASENKTRNRL
jgi:hypothetical protein